MRKAPGGLDVALPCAVVLRGTDDPHRAEKKMGMLFFPLQLHAEKKTQKDQGRQKRG